MQNEPSPILPPLFPVRGDTKYCHLLDLILQLLLLASPFMSVTLLVIALRILFVVLNNSLPGDGTVGGALYLLPYALTGRIRTGLNRLEDWTTLL